MINEMAKVLLRCQLELLNNPSLGREIETQLREADEWQS